jgi:hypothetical protein
MIGNMKNILHNFLKLLGRIQKTEKLPKESMILNSITLPRIECKSTKINYEKPMLKYDDLLPDIETITSYDFCVMKDSEPLVNGLSFIILQDIKYIVIIDQNEYFLGFIDDISVLLEFPPDSDIPSDYQIQAPSFKKQVKNYINYVKNKRIEDIFIFKPFFRCFYKNSATILGAIEEIVQPYGDYIEEKIIPILNENQTILGVVSEQE